MTKNRWTLDDMPDLTGRIAIVTGANSGLGYETALGLARKSAHVIIACRSVEKGDAAREQIRQEVPNAAPDVMELDLASLASIQAFARAFEEKYDALHLLINNAGVMALPRRETADGFEMQFGTNHLGHFALTGHLIDRLLDTPHSRIVTVSSGLHHRGVMNFDDLQGERTYDKWRAYSQSKLANLLFAFELQRKLNAPETTTISVGAHPGYAATNLQYAGPDMEGARVQRWVTSLANRLIAQDAAQGALPTLYAAAAPDVQGGDYIGPDGWQEMRGHPTQVAPSAAAQDADAAARLWQVSVELTDVTYAALAERPTAAPIA
jgi:NAD(P)-dependent dehydrogenase (short-subunit alcohol dehydrogenase family)